MTIEYLIPLAIYTTFGIGGPADIFITVNSAEELIEAITYANNLHKDYFILGTGANILIGDKGYRGVVIKNNARAVSIRNTILTAESGATISDLISLSVADEVSGFEHFAGIPSTVGGALWQNLHFLSSDRSATMYIADMLLSATIYTSKFEKIEVNREYFHFTYDYSILHDQRDIVLSASFQLKRKSRDDIMSVIGSNLEWRNQKHPENAISISAGSVFKKIECFGAGRLIEKVGLKGKKIGGAMISEKHANFIINSGTASAQDVLQLIRLVKHEVFRKLHLTLETEISLIGEF